MSIEHAMVERLRPKMFPAMVSAVVDKEKVKGCLPDIAPAPVSLEPHYCPVGEPRDLALAADQPVFCFEQPPETAELVRFNIWIGQDLICDWIRSELFLKQLQSAKHRTVFTVCGNTDKIVVTIMCHKDDHSIISAAFLGEFPQCLLTIADNCPLDDLPSDAWRNVALRDYFPLPPYSHLFTRKDELVVSSLEPLFSAMANIAAPAVGIYQTVFEAVQPEHNWHRNVEVLLDLEFMGKLVGNAVHYQKYGQQIPSGNLMGMAGDTDRKSHNDKPFYAAAARIAVVGADSVMAQQYVQAISAFMNVFQHGGRPLGYLTEDSYRSYLSEDNIRDMFLKGLTYRAGFLLNSSELVGLVHIPPSTLFSDRSLPMNTIDGLDLPEMDLSEGTHLGYSTYAGETRDVCIPETIRECHSHIIGRPGKGKTTLIRHGSLDDIEKGNGVAIIDPTGDLAKDILRRLPEQYLHKVIYFDPGDPEWIPLWNPLRPLADQDVTRTADDVVGAIKGIVTGWGDRLEHLLRYGVLGILHLGDATLLDVSNVLTPSSDSRERLRKRILEAVNTDNARRFWQSDIKNYTKTDFAPVQHKLSKLLASGTVARMLSQPESKFDFRQIMDDGMIFIANLSGVGTEARGTLGSLILSLFHLTALGRSDIPFEQRRPYHMYVDEAHRFLAGSIEELIAETRQYRVSLTLAHQFMSQFTERKTADALGVVGTTVVFNVLQKDAEHLRKILGEDVQVSDLISLGVGEAIARIGTEVVRIEVAQPSGVPDNTIREKVIEMSRQRYCKHISDMESDSSRGRLSHARPFLNADMDPQEELVYDVLS